MSRITFSYVNNIVQGNLANNYTKIARLQEQLSSGKAITRPSDNPVDATNSLELRADLGSMYQWKRNSEDGSSYLAVVDSTLTKGTEIFQRARERAIQGANDTLTAQDRLYIGKDVRESVLNQMITLANTSYKGDYSFSGHRIDLPPYELKGGNFQLDSGNLTAPLGPAPVTIDLWDTNVSDSINAQVAPFPDGVAQGNARATLMVPGSLQIAGATMVEGTDYRVDYVNGKVELLSAVGVNAANSATGLSFNYEWVRHAENAVDVDIDGAILRQVDKEAPMKINVSAKDVFGQPHDNGDDNSQNTFASIVRLMEGLHGQGAGSVGQPVGTNIASTTIINDSIRGLDTGLRRVLDTAAETGARGNRVDLGIQRLEDREIETRRIQSELEDLDFAKAISDFSLAQAVFEASLQSASKVLQPSLANYL
jgi:flagellar hook-associated protein 3 FlgL